MIVALDSVPAGTISYGALGVRWMKFIYTSKGGSTNSSQGLPNPARAVASAIRDVYDIPLPASTRENTAVYSVGIIGGGQVFNAISEESFFTVDVRANDKAVFAHLVAQITETAEKAATEEHVGFRVESPLALPPGGTREDLTSLRAHPLVQTAIDVQQAVGMPGPILAVPSGSTDANLGVALGIPSIGLATTVGGNQHTRDEYARIDNGLGAKMIVLLAASLAQAR
jgi:acetylornithine deacetylase/succinyl-diaminopimelate desuccinylase-like protein